MPAVLSLLGMLAAAILVLLLAYAAARLAGRYGTAGAMGTPMRGELCVLSQVPVGRGERLVLVRVHERCLLLGTASGGVTLLAELTEEEARPWLEGTAQGADFMQLLRRAGKKK